VQQNFYKVPQYEKCEELLEQFTKFSFQEFLEFLKGASAIGTATVTVTNFQRILKMFTVTVMFEELLEPITVSGL
jgi:hypothetical protein